MATKTITVTEEAYASIKGLKSDTESFSNLFVRLAKEKSVADKYFGVLKGNVNEMRDRFRKIRKDLSDDFERREDVLFRHQRNN